MATKVHLLIDVVGRYFGFMAETGNGEIAGGVGLMEIDWPPHLAHPGDGRRGYVLNVFVEPSYRGLGIARALMETSEAAFRKRRIIYVILHATEAGRPLLRADELVAND